MKSRGVGMFYVLEFLREDEAGVRQRLRSSGYEAPSEARAVQYAQAFLRNVTVQDKQPNVCLVKNVGGKVLGIVSAQSPATQTAKQEMP
jgi:hypothetical protein